MKKLDLRNRKIQAALLLAPILLVAAWLGATAYRRAHIPFQTATIPRLTGQGNRASGLAFSPDGRKVAIADNQNRTWIWNIADRKFERQFRFGSYSPQQIGWGANGLLPLGGSEIIRVYQLPEGTRKWTLPPDWRTRSDQYWRDHKSQTVISPRSTLAVQAQIYGALLVWNLQTGGLHFRLKVPDRETCGVALSPDDKTVAVANMLLKRPPNDPQGFEVTQEGFEIHLRDARTGRLKKLFRYDDAGIMRVLNIMGSLGLMGLAISPDGTQLAASCTNGVRVWDTGSGKLLHTLTQSSDRGMSTHHITFSPDGRLLATTSLVSGIYVWETKTGRYLQYFKGSANNSALVFSPDSRFLATGGQEPGGEAALKLWDVQDLS